MEMKSSTDNSRCRVKLTDAVKTGDIISFYVKLVGYNGGSVEGADMYARGNGTKAVYVDSNGNETTTAVYSGSRIANNAVDCGNGWYYITCMVKADCSSGFELSVDAGNIASGTIGQCVIAGVKINGKEVSVVGYNSGSAITPAAISAPNGSGNTTPTVVKINSYAMEMKSSTDNSRCRVKLTDAVKTGDIISFYVKLVGYNGGSVEGADMYARGNGTKAVYVDSNGNETTTAVYSGSRIANNAVDCGNGWYYITCMVKADCSSGFELSVDAGNIASGAIGQCLIADVRINGSEVSVVGYNSGTAISPVQVTKP